MRETEDNFFCPRAWTEVQENARISPPSISLRSVINVIYYTKTFRVADETSLEFERRKPTNQINWHDYLTGVRGTLTDKQTCTKWTFDVPVTLLTTKHICPLAKFSCVKRAWESRDVLSLHIQSGPRNLTFEKKEEKMNFHLPPYKRYLFAKLLTFFVLYPSTLLNYHSYIYYENTYQYN